MAKKNTLTKAQLVVIHSLRHGDILMSNAPYTYASVFESGRKVHSSTLACLIRKGLVIPAEDGMFGSTQTYILAEGHHASL